jgi:accessory gene regulator B
VINLDIAETLSINFTNKIHVILPDKTDVELEKIKYGIHVLLNNIIKLPIIFTIAFFLGIAKYTLVALLSFSFVRCFASGIHARKSITCLISSAIIFIGTSYAGLNINLNAADMSASFLTCLMLVYLYAPADTEEKPFVNKKLRKNLKLLSCFAVLLLYLLCLLLTKTIYANIITFAVLAECISILPLTYIIFKRRYNNYEIYNR